jgi:16S rRNA (uracil1498-N3)-methyltransferase
MTHRFFIPPDCIRSTEVRFPPETARQMQRVLRLSPGDKVVVLDNTGFQYDVQLEQISSGEAAGKILAQAKVTAEPRVRLTLLLALTQREKFEWMLQKCTELGAAAFLPVITSRCLVQAKEDASRKVPRWETILREASEQCERGLIPHLFSAQSIEQALHQVTSGNLGVPPAAFILSAHEQQVSLRAALERMNPSGIAEIYVLVGPEGGFTLPEVSAAVQAGFQPVSLGPRILRMETASVTVTALVLNQLGEMETKPQPRG